MGKLVAISSSSVDIYDEPEYILNEYAEKVAGDTEGKFAGMVLQTLNADNGEVAYSLYVIAPKLNDYMYRLIEVSLTNLNNPYPLEIKLIAQDPKNNKYGRCYTAVEFKKYIEEYLMSTVTGDILGHLDRLIKIRNIESLGPANAISVNINKRYIDSMSQAELYEASRMAWTIDSTKKDSIKYVLCEYKGVVKEVFKVKNWYPINIADDYGNERIRWAFNGEVAEDTIRKIYKDHSIPYIKTKGSALPVKYLSLNIDRQ